MKEALALARRAVVALEAIAQSLQKVCNAYDRMVTLEQEQDKRNAAASAALLEKQQPLDDYIARQRADLLGQVAHIVVIGGGPCWCGETHYHWDAIKQELNARHGSKKPS